ncbi:hypothetical protein, partial [Achromobacter insuavis]
QAETVTARRGCGKGGRPPKLSTEFVDNSVQNFAGTLAGTGLALVCSKFEQPRMVGNSIKIMFLGRIC